MSNFYDNLNIGGSINIGTVLSGTPQINLGLDSSGNVVSGTTGNTLQEVLVNGNTSGGNNIVMSEGDDLVFRYSTFNNFINTNVLNANRNILFPDKSGTVALLSDITQFTGNTSGDCITDLYVTNLYGCSPITVNDSIQSVTSSATGTTSLSYGFQNNANGLYSISLGNQNNSNGNASVSLGNRNTASGNFSVAEGQSTTASGQASHAEGSETTASGLFSHAEGNNTIASGDYSHAQNNSCQSIGSNSFAGGDTSVASGATSFVFSTNSTVSGNNSAILGGENLTGTEDNFVYIPSLEINGEVRELGGSNLTGDGTLTISGGVSTIGVRINGTNNVTLPNGSRGQKITIYVSDNSGVNTTIGGTFLGYSTVKLAAVGESVQLQYGGASGWIIIGGNNFIAT